jgi:hypothetical protein
MSASIHFTNAVQGYVRTDAELNMSNSNASAFLAVLGFDPNFNNSPVIPLPEFEAALLRFQQSEIAQFVDRGSETTVAQCVNELAEVIGATIVSCGRREGYFSTRVEDALECVKEAKGKSATAVYFA